jgi:predicted TIM-barrel fold metal-dependent hydrolase
MAADQRDLDFKDVPQDIEEQLHGRPRSGLTEPEIKQYQDFIMWCLVKLITNFELPFQIPTGDARIQVSNPILLVDLIDAYTKTKFILFHGGYPWIGETGAIVMKHWRHVWLDSVWLPSLSYTMAKRAFHEWLEVMPSDRIMWDTDCKDAEAIYRAAEFTRRCITEMLTEKVIQGSLRKEHALKIGSQIMRENALSLFPSSMGRLWKKNE